MESPKRCIPHVLPVLLIGVGSVIRVLVCFQHNPMDYLVSDMMRHWGNGLNFPRGGYFGAADPIVYQLYIWFVQKLVGTNRALIALSASMLSLAMPWTYYRATREFGLAKTPALWTWVSHCLHSIPVYVVSLHHDGNLAPFRRRPGSVGDGALPPKRRSNRISIAGRFLDNRLSDQANNCAVGGRLRSLELVEENTFGSRDGFRDNRGDHPALAASNPHQGRAWLFRSVRQSLADSNSTPIRGEIHSCYVS